jgi:predicted nucleic acid-binding protein
VKCFVVEDTSFVVAVLDSRDTYHPDAIFAFQQILSRKDKVQILIPPMVLYETIVTMRRKGTTQATLEDRVMKLVNIKNITVIALSEMSALKHAKSLLNLDQGTALRTHDFLIASTAMEFEAKILTFDKQLKEKCSKHYPEVYYCSSIGGLTDETTAFMAALPAV